MNARRSRSRARTNRPAPFCRRIGGDRAFEFSGRVVFDRSEKGAFTGRSFVNRHMGVGMPSARPRRFCHASRRSHIGAAGSTGSPFLGLPLDGSVAGFVPDRGTTDGHNSYPRAIRSTLGRKPRHQPYRPGRDTAHRPGRRANVLFCSTTASAGRRSRGKRIRSGRAG
jgi:hypothetical protein